MRFKMFGFITQLSYEYKIAILSISMLILEIIALSLMIFDCFILSQ